MYTVAETWLEPNQLCYLPYTYEGMYPDIQIEELSSISGKRRLGLDAIDSICTDEYVQLENKLSYKIFIRITLDGVRPGLEARLSYQNPE